MKKRKKTSVALALTYGFMLMVYAPLEIYFTNKNEFWFDLYGILWIDLLAALGIFAIVYLGLIVGRAIREGVYRFLYAAGSVFVMELYVEGTFLARELPILDGRKVEWQKYAERRYFSIAAFVILTALVIFVIWKFTFPKVEKVLNSIYYILDVTLLVTLFSLAIMNGGFEVKERMVVNKTGEFQYSTDQNLLIFVVDSVDGDAFNGVLEKHPEYRETFRDFTYYSNMLATYTQTHYSLAYLLTGQWYEWDKEKFEEYACRAYDTSEFFGKLETENYRIAVYVTECMPLKANRPYTFENVKKDSAMRIDPANYLYVQAKMVGYRYAPFDLKKHCVVNATKFEVSTKDEEKKNLYYSYNEDFYEDLRTKEFVTTQDKVFKLYHVEGAHVPFRHDENVNVIENGTYEMSIEASFTIVSKWIERLKEEGVYDNSAIIIMSDHGFSKEDDPMGRQHSVFFAKGLNESADEMRTSAAPVSFEDMQLAFQRLLAGASGDSVFDWKEGDDRARRFYYLSYPKLMHNIECLQHGNAGDKSTMEVIQN